jgi:hypothetical protein
MNSIINMEKLIDTTTDETEQKLQKQYLETLTEKEQKAILIADSHLGMSFQLKKSVGYLKWKSKMVAN